MQNDFFTFITQLEFLVTLKTNPFELFTIHNSKNIYYKIKTIFTSSNVENIESSPFKCWIDALKKNINNKIFTIYKTLLVFTMFNTKYLQKH